MPKILTGGNAAGLPITGGAASADPFSPSNASSRSSRSERLVAFDDVLSGASAARRRPAEPETPAAPEAERPAEVSAKPKAKVAKPERRESANEAAEAEQPVEDAPVAANGTQRSDAVEQGDGAGETETGESVEATPVDQDATGEEATDPAGAIVDPAIASAAPTDAQLIAAAQTALPADTAAAAPAPAPGDAVALDADASDAVEAEDVPSLSTASAVANTSAGDGLNAAPDRAPQTVEAVASATTSAARPGPGPVTAATAGASSAKTAAAVDARGADAAAQAPLPGASAETGAEPRAASNPADVVESLNPDDEQAAAAPTTPASSPSPAAPAAGMNVTSDAAALADLAAPQTRAANSPAGAAPAAPTGQPALAPEVQFAEDNHPGIVQGIRGQLLPSGGTMQIRLDPPELGPLAVTINIRDGAVEASFEASNEQAAKLLSHSLSALKTSLESQGVTVDRLNVQQAPKSEAGGNNGNNNDSQQNQPRDPQQEQAAQREQQRREMLRRMWQKLSGVEDPLDMVA